MSSESDVVALQRENETLRERSRDLIVEIQRWKKRCQELEEIISKRAVSDEVMLCTLRNARNDRDHYKRHLEILTKHRW